MVRSNYDSGGISTTGEFVNSDYFSRLKKLGDFDSATKVPYESFDAYHYPYLDFGISQIYGKYYYVIGMIINQNNTSLKYNNLRRTI